MKNQHVHRLKISETKIYCEMGPPVKGEVLKLVVDESCFGVLRASEAGLPNDIYNLILKNAQRNSVQLLMIHFSL